MTRDLPDLGRRRATALLLAGSVLAAAGNACAMDLRQAVDLAWRHNPALEAARHAFAAGQESEKQGKALFLPQITATGSYNYVESHTVSTLPRNGPLSPLVGNASGDLYGFTVTLTQPIYNAAASAGASQLKDQARLASVQFLGARQNMMLQVAQSYFGVLMAENNLQLAHEQQAAIDQQLASAQARFKAGKANITDVRDAQARDQGVVAQELAAASNLEVQQQQFQSLVGTFPKALAHVGSRFKPKAPDPANVQSWIERGRTGNPNVQGARIQISIAQANVDKNRLYNRPQLNLYASYQDTRQNGGLPLLAAPDRAQQTVVGVQLSVPLFAGGAYASELRQAIEQKREADSQLQSTTDSSDLQIRQQYLMVEAAVPQIAALEKAVIAAKSSLDATVLGQKVGERTTLDVLNAQQQYFSSRLNLDSARYQYLLSRLNLAALTGQLGEQDIGLVNGYLSRSP